jgi:tetratricopeptide (TPR) repeat protein
VIRPSAVLICLWALAIGQPASGSLQEEAIAVEPSELTKRSDLIGKKVALDDHVRFYLPRNGDDPDELQLKRTSVTFLVPRKMRFDGITKMSSALVQGVLRRDGTRLVCDVSELKAVASDLDRLENGVKGLGAKDSETRKQWALWAERRAREFKNDNDPVMKRKSEALLKRAREVEAEAFRIETTMKRLGVDAPEEWLAMAKDARRRRVPEPEPEALAHRAFRAQLADKPDFAGLQTIIREIEAFFPRASSDRDSARTNVSRWEARYSADPATAYCDAPENLRRAFDRRLWADASEGLINSEKHPDIASALAAADQAMSLLPEKTDLSARLIEKAVGQARQNLGSLKTTELKELTGILRDKLKRPEDALAVIREWLEIRKGRLRDTDAEGPLELAANYEAMLGDTVTAVALLRKAWRIDPNSKEVAEAFKIRGFRKVGDEWILAAPEQAGRATETRLEAGRSRSLTGMTAEEARQRMGGKPNHVNYLGSKGQMIEQWIYLDTQGVRYVNILHSPGEVKPRVVAFYTLPLPKVRGGLDQKR